MRVTAWNRTPKKKVAGVEFLELDDLLAESDVISLHLLLNDETRGFVSRAFIEAMRPGVIFVNTARGAIVDEQAMIDALESGHIRHAGLDVFNIEPLPKDHPLTKLQQRDAIGAFGVPHAGSQRQSDERGVGALPKDCEGRVVSRRPGQARVARTRPMTGSREPGPITTGRCGEAKLRTPACHRGRAMVPLRRDDDRV